MSLCRWCTRRVALTCSWPQPPDAARYTGNFSRECGRCGSVDESGMWARRSPAKRRRVGKHRVHRAILCCTRSSTPGVVLVPVTKPAVSGRGGRPEQDIDGPVAGWWVVAEMSPAPRAPPRQVRRPDGVDRQLAGDRGSAQPARRLGGGSRAPRAAVSPGEGGRVSPLCCRSSITKLGAA